MKFKFTKSLKNDFLMFLSFIGFIVGFGFVLFFSFGPKSYRRIDLKKIFENGFNNFNFSDSILAIVFLLIIIVSLIFFIKRLVYIKSFSDERNMVDAKVVDIHYVKDRCGVDVEFIFLGEKQKKHFTLMNNSQTKYIHMDSEIQLLIKDENPKKVIIPSLYFEDQ